MRLEQIEPDHLTQDQKPLYNDMKQVIESNFKGFTAIRDDGALLGPWNPWLTFSKIGKPMWELVKSISLSPILPQSVRHITILVIGRKFQAPYQIYAHACMAELIGLPKETLATLLAGEKPSSLTEEESLAYDVTQCLITGGVLPDSLYNQAIHFFNQDGAAELIYLIGLYSMISVTLNGFDVLVDDASDSE